MHILYSIWYFLAEKEKHAKIPRPYHSATLHRTIVTKRKIQNIRLTIIDRIFPAYLGNTKRDINK